MKFSSRLKKKTKEIKKNLNLSTLNNLLLLELKKWLNPEILLVLLIGPLLIRPYCV